MDDTHNGELLRRAFFLLFVLGICTLVAVSLFSGFMPPYKTLFFSISLDNVLHFMAFAMLATVAAPAFRTRSVALAALLVLLLLGFSLEFWQNFLPNRRCTLADAAANMLGIALGGGFGFFLRLRFVEPLPAKAPRRSAAH